MIRVELARSRVDTVPLVAGSAVLDLVNTVSWRGDPKRRIDHLQIGEHCLTWAQRSRVLEPDEAVDLAGRPGVVHGLVAELTGFRELVAAKLIPLGDDPLDRWLSAAIVDAHRHGELAPTTGGRRWVVNILDQHTICRRLALQLESLLIDAPGRIGVCGDEDCRWVFLDTSRGQSRRWCRSTDCGNRNRVRRHQQRAVGSAAN